MKALRDANPEKHKERDAKRYQTDPRVRARHRAYQTTDEGKASMQAAQDRWQAANPEKRKAQVAVSNALRDGRLVKPDNCGTCGATGVKIQAHHADYSQPLSVIWECIPCHRKRH